MIRHSLNTWASAQLWDPDCSGKALSAVAPGWFVYPSRVLPPLPSVVDSKQYVCVALCLSRASRLALDSETGRNNPGGVGGGD